MKTSQIIGIIVVFAVIGVVAILVLTDGKIDLPGSSWRAEVTIQVTRGWVGSDITIQNAETYKGFSILSIGPFFIDWDAEITLTSSREGQIIDRTVQVVNVSFLGRNTLKMNVDLGEFPHGQITATLRGVGSADIEAEKSITI